MTSLSSSLTHVVILLPIYNDWVSAAEVLLRLDSVFLSYAGRVSVLFVDDGSAEVRPSEFGRGPYRKIEAIDIVRLKKNLGHQRAIAVGLCHLTENVHPNTVVVMDSDGQDDAVEALRLVEKLESLSGPNDPAIVFAERTRRSESAGFRASYLGYRLLHVLLTGRTIRFGNFSALSGESLVAVTIEPMLWNHYAASIVARLPFLTLPTQRLPRVAGKSRLNYVGLVTHGLSALSCYNELIGVRLLILSSFLFALSLLAVVGTIFVRLFTSVALPGWTSLFAGILLILLLQIITLATNFTLQMIGSRSAQPFLPIRDYGWYRETVTNLYKTT